MKKIKIEKLDIDNTYFHFTKSQNIKNIEKFGITSEPLERENIVIKDRENPSIYFSFGGKGFLKTIDVWLRWEYNNIALEMKIPRGHIEINKKALKRTHEKVYEDFKERKYLKLDLIEGTDPKTSDFSFSATDYKKELALKENKLNPIFKWLYGNYSNFNSTIVEDWNMNTHVGKKIIESNRIQLITDSFGRTDAIFIIQEMYNKYKTSDLNLKSLDRFMKYIKKKETKQKLIKLIKEIKPKKLYKK